MLPTPLTLIPTMVLDGLFLFMAITALDGNQMFERALLLITEQVNMLSTLKLFPLWPAILNIQLLSQFFGELSTLGVQECVAGYRHKMVLCSHLEYSICNCVHSYSISPCQTPLIFAGLSTRVAGQNSRLVSHPYPATFVSFYHNCSQKISTVEYCYYALGNGFKIRIYNEFVDTGRIQVMYLQAR